MRGSWRLITPGRIYRPPTAADDPAGAELLAPPRWRDELALTRVSWTLVLAMRLVGALNERRSWREARPN